MKAAVVIELDLSDDMLAGMQQLANAVRAMRESKTPEMTYVGNEVLVAIQEPAEELLTWLKEGAEEPVSKHDAGQ